MIIALSLSFVFRRRFCFTILNRLEVMYSIIYANHVLANKKPYPCPVAAVDDPSRDLDSLS